MSSFNGVSLTLKARAWLRKALPKRKDLDYPHFKKVAKVGINKRVFERIKSEVLRTLKAEIKEKVRSGESNKPLTLSSIWFHGQEWKSMAGGRPDRMINTLFNRRTYVASHLLVIFYFERIAEGDMKLYHPKDLILEKLGPDLNRAFGEDGWRWETVWEVAKRILWFGYGRKTFFRINGVGCKIATTRAETAAESLKSYGRGEGHVKSGGKFVDSGNTLKSDRKKVAKTSWASLEVVRNAEDHAVLSTRQERLGIRDWVEEEIEEGAATFYNPYAELEEKVKQRKTRESEVEVWKAIEKLKKKIGDFREFRNPPRE